MQTATPEANGGGRHRRAVIILLGVATFALFGVMFSQTWFNLTFLRPTSSQQTFVFAALSALVFLLFVALLFVLGRNILKVLAERRLGVLGSRFRTRMLLGSLVLSFLPVIALFFFSYGLMNRSIEKWFSRPVEELRQSSEKVADLLAEYAAANARAEAQMIASAPEIQRDFRLNSFDEAPEQLKRYRPALEGGFAMLVAHGEVQSSVDLPASWKNLNGQALAKMAPEDGGRPLHLGGTDYLLRTANVDENAYVAVAMPLPASFSATVQDIEKSQQSYQELSSQRKLIRRTYLLLLLLLTGLVLLAATWLSLLMAKVVTRPVSALAEATREISKGHLGYRVEVAAADELAQLVRSFNAMAAELETSRRQIEASSAELANANQSLDQRRREMETILQSVPNGVLSLNSRREVVHSNRAFHHLFRAGDEAPLTGRAMRDVVPAEIALDLERMVRKSDRMGITASEMDVAHLNLEVTVASLRAQGQPLGYVLVFEDLSDLLRAQKQAAWREVARRVAHEIKNPLTPISLSAERIRRHLERGTPPDENSLAVMHGCAETITGAVEMLRRLVDEFATLARFPAAQPQANDINAIIRSVLQMFEGRLEGVQFRVALGDGLPSVMADAEGIKRVIANLIDNAAEAMQDTIFRELTVTTSLLEQRDMVEIVVADTGHGVNADAKEKLFLPYFSTKERGTGLGLAIVSRIVEEHHGSVRVEKNYPIGSRFTVELPIAAAAEEPAVSAAQVQERNG